jgi:hypothetical protein
MSTKLINDYTKAPVNDRVSEVQADDGTPVVAVRAVGKVRVLHPTFAGVGGRASTSPSAAWCADETKEAERWSLESKVAPSLLQMKVNKVKQPSAIARSKGMRHVSLAQLADDKAGSTVPEWAAEQGKSGQSTAFSASLLVIPSRSPVPRAPKHYPSTPARPRCLPSVLPPALERRPMGCLRTAQTKPVRFPLKLC